MDSTADVFDKFAGTLMTYVENYRVQRTIKNREQAGKSGYSDRFSHIKPTYDVDYEISNEIMDFLDNTLDRGDIDGIWYLTVAACRNVNELPPYLKELADQFMPRFLEIYPQYENMACLHIND